MHASCCSHASNRTSGTRSVPPSSAQTSPGSGDGGNESADWGEDPALRHELQGIFATRTLEEWIQLGIDLRIPLSPAHQRLDDVAADPQIESREIFIEGEHPVAGPFSYVASPAVIDGQPYPMPSAGTSAGAAHRRVARRTRHRRARLGQRALLPGRSPDQVAKALDDVVLAQRVVAHSRHLYQNCSSIESTASPSITGSTPAGLLPPRRCASPRPRCACARIISVVDPPLPQFGV